MAGHIFHDGESSITWGSSKQETVVLLSFEAEDMAWTEAMEQDIWLQELHQHTSESEQRSNIVMKAFEKLKLKEIRGIDEDLSKMDFKFRGENVGLSLKKKNLRYKLKT